TRDVAVIEGMGAAPAKATLEFFVNRAKQRGGQKEAATAPDSSATQRAVGGELDMPSMPGGQPGMIPSTGPLAATVPAVLDACVTALDQFGTKSLPKVFSPRLNWPTEFRFTKCPSRTSESRRRFFHRCPTAKRTFLPNDWV